MKTLSRAFSHPGFNLYRCGIGHLLLAVILSILIPLDQRELLGINLWIKPLKFSLSIWIYCISWQLILKYLPDERLRRRFVNFSIFALTFETLAIVSQAARGELSHFNQSGIYNVVLYAMMGIAITAQTLFSLYVGFRFFKVNPDAISPAMLWAIRLGILIAGIFALEGGYMGQRMAHTVGAADGGPGLPFLNWSLKAGDLRIAHFLGLHALQVLPLFVMAFRLKKPGLVIVFAVLYFCMVSFMFYNALLGFKAQIWRSALMDWFSSAVF